MSNSNDAKGLVAVISLVIAVLFLFGWCFVCCGGSWIAEYANHQTYTGTLKEHYVKHSGDSDDYYITVDVGDEVKTFTLRDSLAKWRFNSAKTYANLPPDGTPVVVETNGWEIASMAFPVVQSIRTKDNK